MALPSPEATLELVKSRRSIRRYRPDPVPDDMVGQLLEAGRWAPSASNRQPWHFVVLEDETIRHEVAERATYHFIGWQHVADAPLLIALCVDMGNPIYRRFAHQDIALAGSQIMLQAHALGLGTCWTGGIDPTILADLLRVPENVEVVGLLSVGFPAEKPSPRRRKPLSEVAHFDVFGSRQPGHGAEPGPVRGGRLSRIWRLIRTHLSSPR